VARDASRHHDATFADRVVEVVAGTRPGEVLTYGEVAAEAGAPGAARAVGNLLRQHGGGLPWWRVVTASGRLVPGLEDRHATLLEAEGIACRDGRLVPPRRPWHPDAEVRGGMR
jgi:methylated-DNA-protein-cysteine methyltransferase related protein